VTAPPIQTHPSDSAFALADLAATIGPDLLDAPLQAHLVRLLRDVLATILAGSQAPELRALAAMTPQLGAGRALVIGTPYRALAHVAAMINGTAGATPEMADGNQFAPNLVSIHLLPAMFALAEDMGASGQEFLLAYLTAYEIAVRTARATRLRDPVHPFGTAMIVGVAAGAARLQGFDRLQTARALEIAAGLCIASSQNAANSGASVRNMFTGLTNHNGLLATKLVLAGFGGEPGAMETVFGAILGERFVLEDVAALGPLYITRNYFKAYACSRWNHAAIEAAETIMAQRSVTPDQIAEVIVHTFNPATRLNRNVIPNAYAGKHSIPFNVAARIVHRSNAPDIYTDAIVHDPVLVALTARTTVREDPALTALQPAIRAARVEIRLTNGEALSALCERARGGFDNPFSDAELEAKFMALAGGALGETRARAVHVAAGEVIAAPSLARLSGRLQTAG
jgi:2-methylcitrate dehydratase PrpD